MKKNRKIKKIGAPGRGRDFSETSWTRARARACNERKREGDGGHARHDTATGCVRTRTRERVPARNMAGSFLRGECRRSLLVRACANIGTRCRILSLSLSPSPLIFASLSLLLFQSCARARALLTSRERYSRAPSTFAPASAVVKVSLPRSPRLLGRAILPTPSQSGVN